MVTLFKTIRNCIMAGLMLAFQPASAYEFSVTNATGEEIAVEIYGIPFGSMMGGVFPANGLFPTQKFWESDFGNTKTINNAGHLRGPYKIAANHTVVFKFTNWDIGVCFDLSQVKAGLSSNGFNMTPADVVALPNVWADAVFGAVSKGGNTVQNVGEAVANVGANIPEPKVQAVVGAIGAGTAAIGALTDVIGTLVRKSTCKHMSFVAVKSKNGFTAQLLTKQQ